MGSEVEVTFYRKEKEKKVFQMECFYDKLHLSLQITNDLHGIRFRSS